MIIGELILYRAALQKIKLDGRKKPNGLYTVCSRPVHPYMVSLYISAGAFLIGAAFCQSTTDLMKYTLGRLRPHFIAACNPDWSKFQCKDDQGLMKYIENPNCLGDGDVIREAR